MSMAVTVSVGRRLTERMSPARWRGILKLIDRDVTRAGQAGEQRMGIETESTASVKEDEECEKQMCLQPPRPSALSLVSWQESRQESQQGLEKIHPCADAHAQACTKTQTVSYNRANPRDRQQLGALQSLGKQHGTKDCPIGDRGDDERK